MTKQLCYLPLILFAFKVVQELVRKLPQGQQLKREVDFVLNQCSETMTPMHYHVREMIFVTYKKVLTKT